MLQCLFRAIWHFVPSYAMCNCAYYAYLEQPFSLYDNYLGLKASNK